MAYQTLIFNDGSIMPDGDAIEVVTPLEWHSADVPTGAFRQIKDMANACEVHFDAPNGLVFGAPPTPAWPGVSRCQLVHGIRQQNVTAWRFTCRQRILYGNGCFAIGLGEQARMNENGLPNQNLIYGGIALFYDAANMYTTFNNHGNYAALQAGVYPLDITQFHEPRVEFNAAGEARIWFNPPYTAGAPDLYLEGAIGDYPWLSNMRGELTYLGLNYTTPPGGAELTDPFTPIYEVPWYHLEAEIQEPPAPVNPGSGGFTQQQTNDTKDGDDWWRSRKAMRRA